MQGSSCAGSVQGSAYAGGVQGPGSVTAERGRCVPECLPIRARQSARHRFGECEFKGAWRRAVLRFCRLEAPVEVSVGDRAGASEELDDAPESGAALLK